MASFAQWCNKKNITFLFIVLPKKIDVQRQMLPPGIEDGAYDNADAFLSRLAHEKVPTLDWRTLFAATPDMIRANFYRTDHHWNNDATFKAAGMLLNEICIRCKVPSSKAKAAKKTAG